MRRRRFLETLPALAPVSVQLAEAAKTEPLPQYRVVSSYKPQGRLGMPGPYVGQVADVHHAKVVDPETEHIDAELVRLMVDKAMLLLTGDKDVRDAWRRFIVPSDVVGIKTNCSGAPQICSHPYVVREIVRNVMEAGVPAKNIHVYERFQDQMDSVGYGKYLPAGVVIGAVSPGRDQLNGYDPKTYVEVDFFGEEDTRSNIIRKVTETFTKIINVPNIKDHGAAGVTGCLKNIAYGNFHNVARSHRYSKTNTYSFIGTLANVEPLKSRTVLHIMDGLKAVWHGGPFSPQKKYRFYPGQILAGTDPVAMDRILLDIVDGHRKSQKAVSVWDRSPSTLRADNDKTDTPNLNRFIREPGHIEFAANMGLGVYDLKKIDHRKVQLG